MPEHLFYVVLEHLFSVLLLRTAFALRGLPQRPGFFCLRDQTFFAAVGGEEAIEAVDQHLTSLVWVLYIWRGSAFPPARAHTGFWRLRPLGLFWFVMFCRRL